MGFWYFLMLVIGGMIVSVALIKHSKSNVAKWSKVFIISSQNPPPSKNVVSREEMNANPMILPVLIC